MKDIENFMYYMFNRWTLEEAKFVFGDNLGTHIYGKWQEVDDTLIWFGWLDKECRHKIADRANEIYNK